VHHLLPEVLVGQDFLLLLVVLAILEDLCHPIKEIRKLKKLVNS
jgi:hypothetical protein